MVTKFWFNSILCWVEDARRAFRCPLDRTMFSRHLELRVNGAMRDLIGFMHSRVRGNGRSVDTCGVVSTPQPRHKSRLGADAEANERRRAAPAACPPRSHAVHHAAVW